MKTRNSRDLPVKKIKKYIVIHQIDLIQPAACENPGPGRDSPNSMHLLTNKQGALAQLLHPLKKLVLTCWERTWIFQLLSKQEAIQQTHPRPAADTTLKFVFIMF